MKHAKPTAFRSLRLLALMATLWVGSVYADDYSDVSQLMRASKHADALAKADLFLANKPRDPQMRFLKGVIQRDTGKTTEAVATFTRLTEDFPELPEPYNNLAVLYAGQSQFDKARTALEMAIRTNPSYATAHENLGDVYAKLASQAYNKALQLDSSNQAVVPKLALIRELFGTKGQRPSLPAATGPGIPGLSPPPVAATPTAKPPPTLPGPVSAKAPASAPVAATVATPPVVTPATTAVSAPAPTQSSAPLAATALAPDAVSSGTASKEAEAAVQAWAAAWSARDVKTYLAAYGKEFEPPGSMKRSAWEDERRQRITSKAKISVKLENLRVTVSGSTAVAKFRQSYKASGLAVSSNKTLELVKSGTHWYITKESTGS